MDSTNNLTIHFPGKLVFGNGSLQQLPDELIMLSCKKVLIVTIGPILSQIEPMKQKLQGNNISVFVHTGIVQEPDFNDFDEVLQYASLIKPDVVLGIGGGSVLDVAKLVAAQLNSKRELSEIVGNGLIKGRNTKLICVPATSGTGSEVSPNSILVDNTDNQKKGIISPYLVPDIVYVDPLLTTTVPPQVTAATGLDALTHCLEAYTNKFAQPFIDMYAIEGIKLIAANITQAVNNGKDATAREKVAMGSMLGGFCLGPVNTAGVHALSYPLGSTFHLAHGLSNALLLPYVMKFNVSAVPRKYADVAIALGVEPQATDLQTAEKGIEKIKMLIKECGVPERLSGVGIPKNAIKQMAEDAMKITRLLKNNPRPITYHDAVAIYTEAY